MRPNIRKRNNGNFSNFGNYATLATLASFLRTRTVQLQTARLLLGLGRGLALGSRFSIQGGFSGIIGIADQDLAEFESRFVNFERSNPRLESRARYPEPSGCPRGSRNPASALG
jgi:hypothetical protein